MSSSFIIFNESNKGVDGAVNGLVGIFYICGFSSVIGIRREKKSELLRQMRVSMVM